MNNTIQDEKRNAHEYPAMYLIVNNVQKEKNIKNMLQSAVAFGVHEIFLVGQKKFDIKQHDKFINSLQIRITRFSSLKECKEHCIDRKIQILGVEIMESAKSVHIHPFHGDTAFIMGNEGSGMNASQIAICDDFVYIPQYGGGTASLNVTVAASILLHSFAVWAKYPEAPMMTDESIVNDRSSCELKAETEN